MNTASSIPSQSNPNHHLDAHPLAPITDDNESIYTKMTQSKRIQSQSAVTEPVKMFSLNSWLSAMDLSIYTNRFLRDGFDKLGAIIELTEQDLREMDIPKGHIKMILRQVVNLRNTTNNANGNGNNNGHSNSTMNTIDEDKSLSASMHRSYANYTQHQRNLSDHSNYKRPRKHSSHSTNSHSDPVIPPIDVILSVPLDDDTDDDDDDNDGDGDGNGSNLIAVASTHRSCGFPDIDTNQIDLHKIHGFTKKVDHEVTESVDDRESVDCTEFHTFPGTSTTRTPLPLNRHLKSSKTPNTNAAIQS